MTTEANQHLRESTRYGAYSPESAPSRRARTGPPPSAEPPSPTADAVPPVPPAADLPVSEPPAAAAHEVESHAGEDPAMVVPLAIESLWARLAKRSVDLIVGVPLFACFLICYPIVGLALKLTSPGPVLFSQVRVGKGGREITVYKFRSMYSHAEDVLRADNQLYERYVRNGFKVPPDHDPRITRVGRLLRLSSLDELRRLYGTSPRAYLACKPGLTGLWQVSGRSQVVYEQRAGLDAAYASEWSLSGDVRILMRTIPVVLSTDGAH